MKNDSWPTYSFTELLRPQEGWATEHAILTTYSADLVVIVTALLALTRCDLDQRRTGSRVELVKAMEALRGRVRVLAQAGRVAIPNTSRPILKLLDGFLRTIDTNENVTSWHPKIALLRFHRIDKTNERQWRIWIGSRNLTHSLNWEAGLTLLSRSDGRGDKIKGINKLAMVLARHAGLKGLVASDVEKELAALTWECPRGAEVKAINLFGPEFDHGIPSPPDDTTRVFIVSPFLDDKCVRSMGQWGGTKARRILVSTALELQRLHSMDAAVFAGFASVRMQPFPDLPEEGAQMLDEEDGSPTEEADEGETLTGLHAKLYFAGNHKRRQLWLGSANATDRGWGGRNYEVVAAMSISRDLSNAIEDFIATCEQFTPGSTKVVSDAGEKELEKARKGLCCHWPLKQRVNDDEVQVIAPKPPPLEPEIQLEVAPFGVPWIIWPHNSSSIVVTGQRPWQRSNFLQIRVSRGERKCAWLQLAPCDPPPDEDRDRAIVAQYLNARTFLLWLRSLLADESAKSGGGDWDDDDTTKKKDGGNNRSDVLPTVEEILRAWARDAAAFAAADKKVTLYLGELERRASEADNKSDMALLHTFRNTWNTLASELR